VLETSGPRSSEWQLCAIELSNAYGRSWPWAALAVPMSAEQAAMSRARRCGQWRLSAFGRCP